MVSHIRWKCFQFFLSVLLVCVFLHVQIKSTPAQSLRPMVVAVSTAVDESSSPIRIAKTLGYFKDEGIDARLVVMRSDLQVAGLVSGDVALAASVSSVAKAAAVGVPVKIVMSFLNGTLFYLVTRPDITSIQELKGKIVAVSRFGSATDFDARAALRHFGLDPARDVKILAVGAGGNRLASLVSKRVDAAILGAVEKFPAEAAGFKTLLATGQYNRQPLGGVGASVERIRGSREELAGALKALYRALGVMKSDPSLVKSIFEKELRLKPDQAEGLYDAMMKVFLPDGEINTRDLSGPYEDARKAATNPPPVSLSDLVDWSILRDVRARAK